MDTSFKDVSLFVIFGRVFLIISKLKQQDRIILSELRYNTVSKRGKTYEVITQAKKQINKIITQGNKQTN